MVGRAFAQMVDYAVIDLLGEPQTVVVDLLSAGSKERCSIGTFGIYRREKYSSPQGLRYLTVDVSREISRSHHSAGISGICNLLEVNFGPPSSASVFPG